MIIIPILYTPLILSLSKTLVSAQGEKFDHMVILTTKFQPTLSQLQIPDTAICADCKGTVLTRITYNSSQSDREIQRAYNGKRIESEEIQVIKVHTNCVLDLQENKLPTKRNRKPPITRHKDFLWIDGKTNQT
jgi:hypothetical protein